MTANVTTYEIAQKFRAAEEKVAREHGGFSLFGLFKREDVAGQWDLVVAAPWLAERADGITQIIDLLNPIFNVQDWQIISTVVPLEPSSDFVQAVTRKFHLEHGLDELSNIYLNDLPIQRAFLITSNPAPAQVSQQLAAA